MANRFKLLFSKILTELDIRSETLRSGRRNYHWNFVNSIPTEEIRNSFIGVENRMGAQVNLNGEQFMVELLVDPNRQAGENVNPSACNLVIKWDQVVYKHVWEVDRLINVYFRWVGEVLEILFDQPEVLYPIINQVLVQQWNLLGQNTLAQNHVRHKNFKLSHVNLQDPVGRLPTQELVNTFMKYGPIDAIHVFTMEGIVHRVQIQRVILQDISLKQSSLSIRIRPIMKVHNGIHIGDDLQIYNRFFHGHLDLVVKKTSEAFESLPIYDI